MGFESSWAKTTDVVRNHYGPREVKDVFGGQRADSDGVKTLEFTLSASDFSSGVFSAYASNSTGVAGMDARVPAGALIKACRANVTTAFSGGSVSVLDVGLEQSSASASTAGWVVGAGADIGTIADATEDGYLLVSLFAVDGTTPAAATAGEVTIIIEYLDENKDGSGRYTAGGVKA
jgi:hypothetical protein